MTHMKSVGKERVKWEADFPAKVSFLRVECFSSEQQHVAVCDAVAFSFISLKSVISVKSLSNQIGIKDMSCIFKLHVLLT